MNTGGIVASTSTATVGQVLNGGGTIGDIPAGVVCMAFEAPVIIGRGWIELLHYCSQGQRQEDQVPEIQPISVHCTGQHRDIVQSEGDHRWGYMNTSWQLLEFSGITNCTVAHILFACIGSINVPSFLCLPLCFVTKHNNASSFFMKSFWQHYQPTFHIVYWPLHMGHSIKLPQKKGSNRSNVLSINNVMWPYVTYPQKLTKQIIFSTKICCATRR